MHAVVSDKSAECTGGGGSEDGTDAARWRQAALKKGVRQFAPLDGVTPI